MQHYYKVRISQSDKYLVYFIAFLTSVLNHNINSKRFSHSRTFHMTFQLEKKEFRSDKWIYNEINFGRVQKRISMSSVHLWTGSSNLSSFAFSGQLSGSVSTRLKRYLQYKPSFHREIDDFYLNWCAVPTAAHPKGAAGAGFFFTYAVLLFNLLCNILMTFSSLLSWWIFLGFALCYLWIS